MDKETVLKIRLRIAEIGGDLQDVRREFRVSETEDVLLREEIVLADKLLGVAFSALMNIHNRLEDKE